MSSCAGHYVVGVDTSKDIVILVDGYRHWLPCSLREWFAVNLFFHRKKVDVISHSWILAVSTFER